MIEVAIGLRLPSGPDSPAFDLEVEFRAAHGVTVLFGPSGAGKSVTLDCIAGFRRPDRGRILLGQTTLFDADRRLHLPPQKRECGYVFQSSALFPHMTLRENLEFALPSSLDRRAVDAMLARFRLEQLGGRYPRQVSGGQQQRCALARSLLRSPRLLLLDEPARGLDAPLRADLYALLRQVRAEFGTPVLLVTHDLEEAFALADDMVVIDHGRVVQTGAPAAVAAEPASVTVARLLDLHLIVGATVESPDGGVLTVDGQRVCGQDLRGFARGQAVWLLVRRMDAQAVPGKQADGLVRRLVGTALTPNGRMLDCGEGVRVPVSEGVWEGSGGAEWWTLRVVGGRVLAR